MNLWLVYKFDIISHLPGYSIPIQTVLVNDIYPPKNPAEDNGKPSLAFDGNPSSFYHAKWVSSDLVGSTPGPGMEIYFGGMFIVSRIIFIPRVNYYLKNNENTIFSILKQDSTEEDCGTLTGTNKVSHEVADQTYVMLCDNKQGIGVKVWKRTAITWCAAEIKIEYSNRK